MGHALAESFPIAAHTFAEADEALGFSLSHLIFNGPEEDLRLTENTQPAILAVSIAAWRVLAEHGVQPSLVGGHSLGEWSAHVAAGTLRFDDALRAVKARGRAMQQAVPPGEGAMAAILSLAAEQVIEACAEASAATGLPAAAANFNSPDQTVISGAAAAVDKAIELVKTRGARRAVLLPVSAPFHCQLMQPAQTAVAQFLQTIELSQPSIPVAANFSGTLVHTATDAQNALVQQVTGAVRWVDCVHALKIAGATTFIEVGPGKVLTGLLRQIDRGLRCLNVEDPASLEKTLAALSTAAVA